MSIFRRGPSPSGGSFTFGVVVALLFQLSTASARVPYPSVAGLTRHWSLEQHTECSPCHVIPRPGAPQKGQANKSLEATAAALWVFGWSVSVLMVLILRAAVPHLC